jgi:deoxyadenosine/deoxycytidine kinase
MKPVEWHLYRQWFEWLIEAHDGRPDAFIYLRTDPAISFQRLRQRSRTEEAGISYEYLKVLHKRHEDWLIHKKDLSPLHEIPVLVLACDEDFEQTKSVWAAHREALVDFLSMRFHLQAPITMTTTVKE